MILKVSYKKTNKFDLHT